MPHMGPVADQLENLSFTLEDEALRVKAGELSSKRRRPHHMFLSGPPGTGKSTVVPVIARMMNEMGVTSDKVIKTSADRLVGTFQGEAETNMNNALEAAKGGVLFIDEAHRLAATRYGRNALSALIAPMADPDFDTTVVFAGYSMDPLLKADPGLRSRVPNDIRFPRMDAEQLAEYAEQRLAHKDMNLRFGTRKAEDAFTDAISVIASRPDHASMRDVNTFLDFANTAKAARLARNPKANTAKARSTLMVADFKEALRRFSKATAEHDELEGMDMGPELEA